MNHMRFIRFFNGYLSCATSTANPSQREKIVGPSIGSKTRDVLIKDPNTLEEFLRNNNLA